VIAVFALGYLCGRLKGTRARIEYGQKLASMVVPFDGLGLRKAYAPFFPAEPDDLQHKAQVDLHRNRRPNTPYYS
jgi:hypothetical protein